MKKLNSNIVTEIAAPAKKKKAEKDSKFTMGTFEWVQAVVLSIAIVVVMLTFLFRFVDVSGHSMEKTLYTDDKVLVSTFMYTPKQGDVIVISHAEKYKKPIVKRVIATSGQEVNIDFDIGKVYVDSKEISEPYLTYTITPGTTNIEFPVKVPDGCVFVMGDNRPVSLDSRYAEIGFIEEKNIVGKVQLVVYPFNRFSFVD